MSRYILIVQEITPQDALAMDFRKSYVYAKFKKIFI